MLVYLVLDMMLLAKYELWIEEIKRICNQGAKETARISLIFIFHLIDSARVFSNTGYLMGIIE